MKPPWFVLVPAAAIFLMSFSSCGGKTGDKSKKGDEGIFKKALKGAIPVTSYVVAAREVPWTINASGRTEASDRYQAKAPGDVKVQNVMVEEGARVEPGDPLVRFDEERIRLRLTLARAEMQEGEAEISLVQNLQKNRDELVGEGKLSETEATVLDERLNYAQAKVERARAEVELLEKSTDLRELNSPFAGVVTKKEIADGASVDEDQVLLEVVKLDPLYFTFSVPSEAATVLEREKEVEVTVRLQGLAQELTGEIAVIGAGAEEAGAANGGGVSVKVRLPNTDLALKADIRGTAEVRTTARRKILVVPETAVVKGDKTHYIFRVDTTSEKPKVRRVPVELGDDYNNQPTVTKGLNEGDTIVASSEDDLRDGAAVEIQATRSAVP